MELGEEKQRKQRDEWLCLLKLKRKMQSQSPSQLIILQQSMDHDRNHNHDICRMYLSIRPPSCVHSGNKDGIPQCILYSVNA